MEEYIIYVNEQIEKFKRYTEFGKVSTELTAAEINTALYEYSQISLMLNAEYQRLKYQERQFMRKYILWWDKIFTETRRELNPITIAASKWLSKQEIESEARVKHEKEFLEWEAQKDEIESKVNFFRSLREDWKIQSQIIINLGQNVRSELSNLSIDSRINRQIRQVRQKL